MDNRSTFYGPNGLFVGWRVASFVVLAAAVSEILRLLWLHVFLVFARRASIPIGSKTLDVACIVLAVLISLLLAKFAKPNMFFGPRGLRAGWRVALFLLLVIAIGALLNLLFVLILHKPGREASITAGPVILSGMGNVLTVLIALVVLARIDGTSVASYGFPLRSAFGSRFWVGAVWGFGALSLLLLGIKLLHGVDVGAIQGSSTYEGRQAVLFAIGFILVGLFEELLFRSYMLFSLARGMGFWPGAIVTAVIFGAAHSGNPGEHWYGLLAVVAVGLLFCLFLRRTGDLWFLIGFHFAWDWAETYFYGTPDSGIAASGSLFHAQFHGPAWITGGSVGPEGSALCFVVIVITGGIFSAIYREVRYFPEAVETPGAMLREPAVAGDGSVTTATSGT